MANKLSVQELEALNEKRLGLPSGLLGSIRKQETGGKQSYLDDPGKYHYALNEQGRRIAGHTGKESTAFGPYGLLESTAKKPGYGVAPLSDKSIEEQVRFAADYVAGRIKSAGSLEKGIGGYGEGAKYANQVLGRLGKGDGTAPVYAGTPGNEPARLAKGQGVPTQVASKQTAPEALNQMAAAQYVPENPYTPLSDVNLPQIAAIKAMQGGSDPWQEFLSAMAPKPSAKDMQYGVRPVPILDDYGYDAPDIESIMAMFGGAPQVNLNDLEGFG